MTSATEWRWLCIECGTDLGPMVGKHAARCPKCGSRSAVCQQVGRDYEKATVKR